MARVLGRYSMADSAVCYGQMTFRGTRKVETAKQWTGALIFCCFGTIISMMSQPTVHGQRLLILSCSQSKRSDSCLLPALARYDGPPFRVLHKFCVHEPIKAQALEIYILSAKFGLISANHRIPYYDQRMTDERANSLKLCVAKQMKQALNRRQYEQLFLSLGRDYFRVIEGYEQLISPDVQVILSDGTPGRKLTNLRDWLYGAPTMFPRHAAVALRRGEVCLRGIKIELTCEQVIDLARRALAEGRGNPTNYHSWCVFVDAQRVAPKWLVSQVTGLPPKAFVADEARRVLEQLGIEVRRV